MWGRTLLAVVAVRALVWPDQSQWRTCRDDLHCVITSYGEAVQEWNSISHFGDALQRFGDMLLCLASLPSDCSPLVPLVPGDPYRSAAAVTRKLEQLRVSSSMGIITLDSEELREELVSPWDPRSVGEAKNCFQNVARTLEECRTLATEEAPDERLTKEQTKSILDALRAVATTCKALAS